MGNDTRLALSDIKGPCNDLVEKLDGEEGEEWLRALKMLLRKENPWGIKTEIFATVEVGTFKDIYYLTSKLVECGVEIEGHVGSLLPRIQLHDTKRIIDLVLVSVKELNFSSETNPYWEDVCRAIKRLGLGFVPAEVGPQLCIQYSGKPVKDRYGWCALGMKPMGSGADLFYLNLGKERRVLSTLNRFGAWNDKSQLILARYRQPEHI